ncbi:hypothetical protein L332_06125 [Agrococcus pavilionensis RW1]|uniref:DUF3027 domain-containing protein n=1 Tax=Agrococcus pavilionensis RW1 TaxID=1330458 RepID=U1MTN6_9MICO|nr:DUF3027 domain-containing protein [Agrococcus pavilionensis]ERG64035.1 hypothetical protein L332_06125 [Agrococcus pavilionensis RW1]
MTSTPETADGVPAEDAPLDIVPVYDGSVEPAAAPAGAEPAPAAEVDEPTTADDASADEPVEAADEATDESDERPAAPEPTPTVPTPTVPTPTVPTMQELELALSALDDVAPKGAVGEVQDALGEGDHVVAIRHASRLPGYPDWSWTVLLSRGIEGGPTVLEVALLPGEGSLLAPAWVPWSERLADYLAAREAAAEDGDDEELESDLESDLDDDFDDDFEDVDDDGDGRGDHVDELADDLADDEE